MIEPISIVECCDNMEFMVKFPDKFFDLGCVDPGYGIGENWTKSKNSIHYKHHSSYKNKSIPTKEYFNELFRVSKNQIIWGGNYFTEFLRPTNSWIIWDKLKEVEKTFQSECELAWTSFKVPTRFFRFQWDGARKSTETGSTRIHPHQKPITLYQFCFEKYLTPGAKILDTNLASQSSRIAAYKLGFYFWGCEIDEDYFKEGCKRFDKECQGITEQQGIKVKQQKLFL